jgi:hypothetical protein
MLKNPEWNRRELGSELGETETMFINYCGQSGSESNIMLWGDRFFGGARVIPTEDKGVDRGHSD